MCERDFLIPVSGIARLRMDTDGPGIRTLIATYGCPLRCKYCINPHTWRKDGHVRRMTGQELFREIAVDSLYFQATGGGITIGGGEPLLHMEKLEAFLKLCPKEWNLWAETSLAVDSNAVIKASRYFHHFLVDIKSLDEDIYHAYTGGSRTAALNNLRLLHSLVGNDRITVRLPLIPGYSSEEQQKKDSGILREMGFTDLDLFTYRTERS